MIKVFSVLAVFTFFAACGNSGGKADENAVIASFQTTPAVIKTNGVETEAKLTVFDNGAKMKLELKIKNISQSSINFDPAGITLYSDAIMNNIYDFTGGGTGITPGKEVTMTAIFKPVNNPYTMQKYNLPGDVKKSYSLPLSFILDEKGQPVSEASIRFDMSDADYKSYTNTYGIENKLTGFDLSVNNPVFIDGQSKYLKEHHLMAKCEEDQKGVTHEDTNSYITVSGNELITDNLMLKIVGYKIGNDFYVYFKVISRVSDELTLDPKLFTVLAGDAKFAPVNDPLKDLKDLRIENGKLILGLNDRVEMIFRYTPGNLPYTIYWDVPGFKNSKGVPLFYAAISLTNTGTK